MAAYMRFRKANQVWAVINNYFWRPCPVCEQYFGGHEAVWEHYWTNRERTKGKAICPDCGKTGETHYEGET